jgi:hemoglobin/transferrin/lactoferrin receptor protein
MGFRATWISGSTKEAVGAKFSNNPSIGHMKKKDFGIAGNLGLVYTGIDGLALRGTISQGYRYPSMTQLYLGSNSNGGATTISTLPNSDLEPEKSINYEVGARVDKGPWSMDLALYYTEAKNYIASISCTEAPFGPCAGSINSTNSMYYNQNKSKAYGTELMLSYMIDKYNLKPYMNLTQVNRVNIDRDGAKTKSNSPPLKGRFGFTWEAELDNNKRFYSDVFVNWASKVKASGTSSSTNPGWGTGNITIGIQGGEDHKYDASLSIRNIFDKLYYLRRGGSDPAYGTQIVMSVGYEW